MTDTNNNPPSARRDPSRQSGLTDLIHHDHAQARPVAGTIRLDETGLDTDAVETWEIAQGLDVLSADDEKLGEVVDVLPGHLVVEQGFYNPTDIYVPVSLVARHDDACLTLAMTQEEFERRDWSVRPDDAVPEATLET